jgi:hypothetical protein
MKKLLIGVLVGLSGILAGSAVFAEACTYNEAIIALKQGNQIRGTVLLRMAAKDGDVRAQAYLAEMNAGNIAKHVVVTENFTKEHKLTSNLTR